MKKLLIVLAVIAVSSATDFNLNEMCQGILFATLPHPTDSNLFIGCIKGKGTVLGCSHENEVFDSYLVECVKNDNPVNPPHEELCRREVSGWFPHESDCALYIVCQFSRTEVRECPEERVFNVYLPGCVPGNRDTCEMYYHTTPSTTVEMTTPSTTSEVTTTETAATPKSTWSISTETAPITRDPDEIAISFVCPIEGFGYIPHQSDCSRYFECIQGIRFPRNCPNGLIFDVITRRCNDPAKSLCANNIRCI